MRYAARSLVHSPYTHASKLAPAARFDLTSSAVQAVSLNQLPVRLDELELSGNAPYGDPSLIERLAARAAVSTDCVVPTIGTSLANHLAFSALFDPGDEVLIEQPTYDPLLHTARLLGAIVRRFPRHEENNFAIDPADVLRAITPRTRLVALCNLHNPTSAAVSDEVLQSIGEAAASVGAHVLVDEVYREAIWGASQRHAFALGPQFVVTSSLTKAYGLGGLRCGWILAEPVLAARIRQMQDLFGATGAYIAERLGAIALASIGQLENRASLILRANRAIAAELLTARHDLQLTIPAHGTTLAPRLLHNPVEPFCEMLRARYELAVVPGFYFEMPRHFRIGLGGDPRLFRESLERLTRALDDLTALEPRCAQ
jgi:aspartate/methionine/tyrosine aminotransferase